MCRRALVCLPTFYVTSCESRQLRGLAHAGSSELTYDMIRAVFDELKHEDADLGYCVQASRNPGLRANRLF
jgi:hypothetical protein